MNHFSEKVSFIWSVADLLRGPYKPHQYGRVILPLTVLRRLDCVLEPTKQRLLEKHATLKGQSIEVVEKLLNRAAGQSFHNTSKLDFQKLKGDPDKIAANLAQYTKSFSSNARQIFEFFEFDKELAKLEEANILYLVVRKFAEIDLHPDVVPNHEMGLIFEDLIRRFNEASNETAGDHFTPREVIRLMVNLLFDPDTHALRTKGIVRTVYDPACGTGGMLSVAEEYLRELNPDARLEVFGQDYNNESFAICCSDMMIKGLNPENVKFGNSFTKDGLPGMKFDYMLANPPFGVEWKKEQEFIEKEHDQNGLDGRFGAGLPRINDGSLLFLQHMISKMKREGSRIGIVFNGSPLFTGDAGSGESEIRKWIVENDWLETIVALPDQMFYNTGISTYIWIVTNRKRKDRRGKVQLINAADLFSKMRRNLGEKRHELTEEHIQEITHIYGEFKECNRSKIFDNRDFGYRQITVERPLRLSFKITPRRIDEVKHSAAYERLATGQRKRGATRRELDPGVQIQEKVIAALNEMDQSRVYKTRKEFETRLDAAAISGGVSLSTPLKKAIIDVMSERDDTAETCLNLQAKPEPDPELRDFENVPLKENVADYFRREVLPYATDAWIDESKTTVGYEIPFNRYFYKYSPPRPLDEIQAEIKLTEKEILKLIAEIVE
jgi:type I restriction enzyme M protein